MIARISALVVLLGMLCAFRPTPVRADDPEPTAASATTTVNPIEALIEQSTLAMRTEPDVSKREADQALELLKKSPDPDLEIRARQRSERAVAGRIEE